VFLLILIFGGGILEFLEARQQQKFAHEREMARIKAFGCVCRKDNAAKDSK
jgi:hypothetical protein